MASFSGALGCGGNVCGSGSWCPAACRRGMSCCEAARPVCVPVGCLADRDVALARRQAEVARLMAQLAAAEGELAMARAPVVAVAVVETCPNNKWCEDTSCAFSHRECRDGDKCRNPACTFRHNVACRFGGERCRNKDKAAGEGKCHFIGAGAHDGKCVIAPKSCPWGAGCRNVTKCHYAHTVVAETAPVVEAPKRTPVAHQSAAVAAPAPKRKHVAHQAAAVAAPVVAETAPVVEAPKRKPVAHQAAAVAAPAPKAKPLCRLGAECTWGAKCAFKHPKPSSS